MLNDRYNNDQSEPPPLFSDCKSEFVLAFSKSSFSTSIALLIQLGIEFQKTKLVCNFALLYLKDAVILTKADVEIPS